MNIIMYTKPVLEQLNMASSDPNFFCMSLSRIFYDPRRIVAFMMGLLLTSDGSKICFCALHLLEVGSARNCHGREFLSIDRVREPFPCDLLLGYELRTFFQFEKLTAPK